MEEGEKANDMKRKTGDNGTGGVEWRGGWKDKLEI